jgi:hypothetical protein
MQEPLLKTITYLGFECVWLENSVLSLLVTRSVGPRIISLRLNGGENLLAELPDYVTERPDGRTYHFYGGHRLWHAPEDMPRTYALDDGPVEVTPKPDGLLVTQPLEPQTGIEKSMHISLVDEKPQVIVRHTLTNLGMWPVECAPWAITQLKPGGVAILPQSQQPTDFLPNRSLALWPYTEIADPQVTWGGRYILVRAEKRDGAFKVGFPNLRGWLAYWNAGTLFVKRAAFDPGAAYYDFNSSSECYCNGRFLELETLGPVRSLEPGASVTHVETWELYAGVDCPGDEAAARALVDKLGLE